MSKAIKILFLAANPTDTTRLRLDEEVRDIDLALRQVKFRDRFDLRQHWAVRVTDLQGYLLRHTPDIVHFSGHGSRSSEIILENSNGNSCPVSTHALNQLFFVLKDNIRCVFLNACYSEGQAQAIAKHIDCVLGMSKAIVDRAAIGFATAFYQALGYGRDVKTAFDLGCVQIDLENIGEQDTPKLIALNHDPKQIIFTSAKIAVQEQIESEAFEVLEPKNATHDHTLGKLATKETRADLETDMNYLRIQRNQADKVRRAVPENHYIVNLPPLDVKNTFKDRLYEIENLYQYLGEEDVRLVSILGRGGVGKTALVSYVLGGLEHGMSYLPDKAQRFTVDGILYLSARSTGLSLERIYDDVGYMLGEQVASLMATRWADEGLSLAAKVEYLLRSLKGGLYIILLDNLEDELTDDGTISSEGLYLFIERCLTQPTGVRLVITSRIEPQLPSAALHRVRRVYLFEGLPEDDSIDLLRELDPQKQLGLRNASETDLRYAIQITQGIPRALEVLAGILLEDPALSLSRLLFDKQLGGEQVVEQLIAEGYHRLGDAEQRVLEALAVFNCLVETAAVAYLLHPWFPDLDVRSSLHRLLRSYFIKSNRLTGKYSIHPLDRDYAYHQIPEPVDELEDLNAYNKRNLELRAADFYANISKPESEWLSISDLKPKLGEFEHRMKAGDYDTAAKIVNNIDHNYLSRWGYFERVLTMRQAIADTIIDQSLRGRNLCDLGMVLHELGQQEQSISYHEQAIEVAHSTGDIGEEERNLRGLGVSYRSIGDYERAIEHYQLALALAKKIGDKQAQHQNLGGMGQTYRNMGKIEQAIDYLEKALKVARSAGDRDGECRQSSHLGLAYLALGLYDKAIDCNQQALVIARERGYRRREAIALGHLGWIYNELGQYHQAIEHHKQGLDIAREIGARVIEGHRLAGLSEAYLGMGNLNAAQEKVLIALDAANEVISPRQQQRQGTMLAQIYLHMRLLDKALATIIVARHYDKLEINHRSALLQGIILARLGQKEKAHAAFNESLDQTNRLLIHTPHHCKAKYTRGIALSGLALLTMDNDKKLAYLTQTKHACFDARTNCGTRGLINDALDLLNELREIDSDGILSPIQKSLLSN